MAGMDTFRRKVKKLRKKLKDEARQSAFDMLLKLSNKMDTGLADPYGFIQSLEEELEFLRDEIQPKLKELVFNTEEEINSESNKLLRAIKDFYYDAEDILDECNTEVGRRRQLSDDDHRSNLAVEEQQQHQSLMERPLFPGDFSFSSFQIKFANKIRDLYSKLRKVMGRKNTFLERVKPMLNYYFAPRRMGTVVSSDEKREDQHDAMLPKDFRMEGRDEDKEYVINLILRETHEDGPCVLLIAGMGGIGKTTLVQDIYQDPKVEDHFQDFKTWVHVGEKELDFDEVMDPNISPKEMKEMRFLIVLDVVSNTEQLESQWNKVWDGLTYGAKGSWIIVITRQEDVKEKMGRAPDKLKKLHPLADKDCIQIFESYAFPSAFAESTSSSSTSFCRIPKDHNRLKEIGRKIVCEKIKGIPLAAVVVGLSLKDETDEKVWLEALSKIECCETEDEIKSALMWGYRCLPTHLKQCFAYWSVFRKGEEVSRSDIIQRWMAHGFLNQCGHHQTLEDVGERYLQDLVSVSLLIRGGIRDEIDESTRVFKMHDLIHDIAMDVSKHKTMGNNFEHIPEQLMVYVRHLSMQDDSPINASGIKKLWSFAGKYSHISALHDQLKTVRELHISDQCQRELVIDFADMVHLRLLDLRHMCKLKSLPESLCHLYNLQTLILPSHYEEVELPECMGKLVNLRHIESGREEENYRDIPRVCRELASLQTLRGRFHLSYNRTHGLSELQNLSQLRGYLLINSLNCVAGIRCARDAKLDKKAGLLSLILDMVGPGRELLNSLKPPKDLKVLEIYNYRGDELPTWMEEHKLLKIVDLTLSNCVGLKKLSHLAHLHHLKSLKLKNLSKIQRIGAEFYGIDPRGENILFSSLIKFSLEEMDALEEWEGPVMPNNTVSTGSIQCFPLLQSLHVSYCNKLRWLPLDHVCKLVDLILYKSNLKRLDLRCLTLLKELMISDCMDKDILLPNCSRTLVIGDCRKLRRCLPLHHWCNLVRLTIFNMSNLERLDLQGHHLLKELDIHTCDNLEEIRLPNCSYPLRSLEILNCPTLRRCMDTDNQLYASTYIRTDTWEIILRRADPRNVRSLQLVRIDFDCKMSYDDQMWLSSWFKNLSSVEDIWIFEIKGNSFPSFVDLRDLNSLQELHIDSCPNLQTLPEFPSSLSRRDIQINSCPLLEQQIYEVEMQLQDGLSVGGSMEITHLASQGHAQVQSEGPKQLQVENNGILNVSSNVEKGKRKRTRTSGVWPHFDVIKKSSEDDKEKARCRHCGRELKSDTKNGTNSLRKHLRQMHKIYISNSR